MAKNKLDDSSELLITDQKDFEFIHPHSITVNPRDLQEREDRGNPIWRGGLLRIGHGGV